MNITSTITSNLDYLMIQPEASGKRKASDDNSNGAPKPKRTRKDVSFLDPVSLDNVECHGTEFRFPEA
jgi:hypothetical protein